jgi:hypothetical protein
MILINGAKDTLKSELIKILLNGTCNASVFLKVS